MALQMVHLAGLVEVSLEVFLAVSLVEEGGRSVVVN
jgi:hypothetical protein